MKILFAILKLCFKLALVILYLITKAAEMALQVINELLQKSFEHK